MNRPRFNIFNFSIFRNSAESRNFVAITIKTPMIRNVFAWFVLLGALLFTACNDYETYGEKKDKERKAIRAFMAQEGITPITESQFKQQGYVTDVETNQFVYMEKSGVYMQITRQGCGEKLKENEELTILCRFIEVPLYEEENTISDYAYPYDETKIKIEKTGSTITARFLEGVMKDTYGENVPTGWIVPLNYINIGRDTQSPTDQLAKVKLIVPHSQGNTNATAYVYPYYYEITFARQR